MTIIKVTITGAKTNTADRIVRYFSSQASAEDYVDNRSRTDAPGTVTTVKRIKVND